MRSTSNMRAIAATVLFSGTLGVLIAVTVFGLARVADQMLEAISLIPLHWGENHVAALFEIAAAASLPVVVWFSFWFFKKAKATEIMLSEYRYAPPEK
ncbi:MAG: hypothetical protein AB7E79_03445 [Rhodospirillaceae bacterium]